MRSPYIHIKDNMKSKFKKFILFVVILLVIALGCSFYYVHSAGKPFDAKSDKRINIEVVQGATVKTISDELEKKGVIKSSFAFRLYCKVHGLDNGFQAGSYLFSPSMSAEDIAKDLKTGNVDNTTFTIPEGYTTKQIAKKLSKDGVVDYDKFMNAVANEKFDYSFLDDSVQGESRLEGFLFPDTYSVPKGSNEKFIINEMLKRFDEIYTPDMRKKAKKMGYTDREIVTVASIIERETVLDDERAKVASVIYNRLDKNMKLQMCSCVQFLLGKQKHFLDENDISIESPYNTYIYEGLPPGPIACPGKASLEAALNPAKTDYIYFVVSDKGDGSMKFSKDYDEFLKNKEDYYASVEGK